MTDRRPKNLAIRIPPELLERLRTEAAARDLSMNYLATKALAQFLDRLIPVEDWKLTRDD